MNADDSAVSISTKPLPAPSLSRRMCCWVYEGMLLFAVVFIASYFFSSLTQTRHGLQNRLGQQIFIFFVLGMYFSWFWYKGQTLAMKTWHIRALDIHGNPLTKKRAWARYVLSWIWFVPPLVMIELWQLPMTTGLFLCFFG
ncbi:MAG: RDD family protein [Limnohabitans sp.]